MSRGFLKAIHKLLFAFSLLTALFTIFGIRPASTESRPQGNAPVSAPAAGQQNQPQIAKGLNTSLAVWSDRRTVLNRYVPDDNAGIGSNTDIYAARLDADGNVIDTAPIVVNEAIYEQYYPQVAWNGQNWLVTWITKRKTNQFDLDILAVRISPEGQVLDATPIPIYITPDSAGDPSYLNIASDGTNWAVIFGEGSNNSSIYGVRVAPDGSVIDSTPKTLFQDTNFTAPFWADIAYSNNQFLLVWERTISGGRAINALRLDNSLNPVGATFRVNVFSGSDGSNARVASDGTNYFVIWREDRFAYNEIFGTRISGGGEVLDPNGIKLYGSAGEFILNYNTALAWDGAAYVASYHGRPINADESVFANRIAPDGTASAAVPVALSTGATQPAVGALPNGGAKILWTDNRLSIDGDIFGANLSTGGTVGATAPVSLGAPRETQIRFTKTAAGDFTYVYRSTVSGASSIYLQRLNANGAALGEPSLVTQGAEAIFNPSVAWNGAVYLVAWEFNGQTFGRRVAADGSPISAEFLVSVGNMPDVAALDSQFLVVNSFPRTTQLRHTQATRVAGDGAVQTPVRIGNNFDIRPRVRAFANRWLVVWESDISHDNPNSNIAAAFVEADGTAPGGEFSVGSFGDAPHLAIGGDTALVVWQDSNDIYARRLNSAGAFLGEKFIAAESPRTTFAPAAAWDGSRFIVTYADSRNSTILPPPDIWATLIATDGTRLTPTGFPVAASPLPEEMPSVEAANGTTIFGYSMFDDRAPFTNYRIRLRKFPFDTSFNVSVTPFQRQVAADASTTYTVDVNALNNFNGVVELRVYGLPDGATASFNPPTITGSGQTTLTITTSVATPEEFYRLSINASSGAEQSSADAVLIVDDNPPPVGYSVTDLGTLGGTESAAYGINQSGQIVGYAFNANQRRRAFRYSNGQMQDLGTLGGQNSTALGINDAGNVVGYSDVTGTGDVRAFFYNGTTMQNLGTYQGGGTVPYSAAFAINNSNQIVGETSTDGGSRIAFLFQNNQMTIVGTPFAFGTARGINDAGKIVGAQYVGDGITKAYVINSDNTNPVFIETLGGREASAWAINATGAVVGSSDYSLNNTFDHAFLYNGGQVRDLNGFNAPQSFAYDINDGGQIVGTFYLTQFGDPRAFMHDGTTMRNLNSLIPQNSGWILQEARGVNNNGQIVGQGTINNQKHAFLLNPNGEQNAPPSIRIINPLNAGRTESGGISISAAAEDADGAVVRVEFYANGNLIGTASSNPFVALWNAAPGTYTLTAKAFDNAGASTVSAPVTITVGGAAQVSRTRFDFDGDGKSDLSVYRGGEWHLNQSTNGYAVANFGVAGDKLTPADYDGDGKTDLAVYRSGVWYLLRSTQGFGALQFGVAEDVPQPADYDGDGKAEIAVFRPSTGVWYIYNLATAQTGIVQFGLSEDKPVAADYTGDGRAEIAVWRPSSGDWYHLNPANNQYGVIHFGASGDVPVPADYDGDGQTDFAVFRGGTWYLQQSTGGFGAVQFGVAGDIPTVADFDGDGKANISVFRQGVWYYLNGANNPVIQQFGVSNDVPVQGAFNP